MHGKYWLASLLGLLTLLSNVGLNAAQPELEASFVSPPDSARPWVYWFWLNGNISKEGITADLEAMQRAGIGGALIMEVDQGAPRGSVAFMSDEWRSLFKWAITEAQRLGLEVTMNNDAGWSGSGGPWVPPEQGTQLVVTSETRVTGGEKFEGILPRPPANGGFYRDIAVQAFPTPAASDRVANLPAKSVSWGYISGYSTGTNRDAQVPAGALIAKERIVDLSAKMDGEGKLVWDAPAIDGGWTVVRFGHTFTGTMNHPAPASGQGPECDKLSKEALKTHFHGMIGKLIQDVGPLSGKAFAATHVDSWENGAGNWTPKMREDFKRLRGYDMLPFLPALTGRFVDSVDTTERFLWDLRQTASDLFEANYIGHLAKLAHDHGLRLSMETYGTPALDMDVVNQVDEPMCEFWWSGGGRLEYSIKSMASAAHVNGRPIVGAEAFTSNRRERWRGHPANIKTRGDRAFCGGVNRFVVHRYAMQPWVQDLRPGMSMGPYGLHYERTQTWWEDSKAWHQYLARCQHLLRQGRFVADVLSLQPEEPMQRFNLLNLRGHDYDGIGPKAFLGKARMENGRLTLSSGMQYRLLMLSGTNAKNMSVPMLKKIRQLVEDGAAILGDAPETTPGLENYPQADAELKKMAEELWGTDPAVKERVVGKGKVFRGMKPEEVLAKLDVLSDFSSQQNLNWIHRAADGADIYFLATCVDTPVSATCTFRISGRQPELWDPETGSIRPIPFYWAEPNGCTSVPLQFGPSGSAFVVFREKADPARQIVRVNKNGEPLLDATQTLSSTPAALAAIDLVKGTVLEAGIYEIQTADGKSNAFVIGAIPEPQEIAGPWQVRFPLRWGAPEQITLEKLASWSRHPDPGVRHFSGRATYSKTIIFPPDAYDKRRRTYLDLGKVAVMAEVKLNGKRLGVLWKSPYKVDVTDAVKNDENSLEVSVANLWINRMIGDELLPADSACNGDGSLLRWPVWLLEGKPNPTGRFTFSNWRLYRKGEELQESGLIGPVRILVTEAIP